MTWPFGHLAAGGYDVIVADPPWHFKSWGKGANPKSAAYHYGLMGLDAIKALPVKELAARDCILFLWSTAPMLPHALETLTAWGFGYSSRTAWRKTYEFGAPAVGTGHWVRSMHEDVLIGRIGKPKLLKAIPSLFNGVRGVHSQKPTEFFDLVGAVTPDARRCELFSRQGHIGFTGWGDEVGKLDPPLFPKGLRENFADVETWRSQRLRSLLAGLEDA